VVVVLVHRTGWACGPPAVLVATAGTVGLLAGWAAIDRLFTPVRRGPGWSSAAPAHGRLDAADHAAFAGHWRRGGAYLTECERQEREARP
jgi:hypothetical protein